ncbi:MAG TPA: threonine synthase [Bacteroidales bacterium]|nr:threonine synthase [Bacteroidales bacterium]
MKYFSTRDTLRQSPAGFADAVVQGLAPDGGLFMPESISVLDAGSLTGLNADKLPVLAATMLKPFVKDELADEQLQHLCAEVFNFPLPLVKLNENLYTLELFHGPTLAFKDFGARFMARVLSSIAQEKGVEIRVLVATSGDTGSAVASGFYRVPGIRVFILYPKGRVSPGQQKQLTTWGENITALEIEGSFDDCQRHVKQLLSGYGPGGHFLLTSANSINIARLLPQMVYYAAAGLKLKDREVVFSVPSGNFGNLTAGLMAAAMGFPAEHFVAATNINDVVPHFLHTGHFQPRTSVSTLSNAMDVGNPSNFERMQALFGHDRERMMASVSGAAFTDSQTITAMRELYESYGYVADPHGAIGYLGAKRFNERFPEAAFVFLETAHPAKFPDTVRQAIGNEAEVPERLSAFFEKTEQKITLPNDFQKVYDLVCGS